ncbi:MAG: VTT domain-containing protein [Pseudomonadota bacterium]|nr:MAG: hypothetical protein DIU78_21095 [Pseudomonadota bacterium]
MKLGRLLRLAGALALCLLLVFALFQWTGASRFMEPGALHTGGPLAALLGVGLLTADVVLPVPSSVVMLAHGAWFGTVGGTVLSLTGGTLATLTAILLGRSARRFVERVTSEEERAYATRLVERWGMAAIAATRPIPILAETVAITAGALGVAPLRALLAGALGSLPASVLYAWAGARGLDSASDVAVFGLVVLVTLALFLVGRRASGRSTR